jgi:apolipoprotein N-acyltransferase
MSHFELRKAAAAMGSGILVALGMPGFGLFPLLFVGLVPLFYALEGTGGFLYGLIFGLSFFALDQRWVLTVFRFSPLVVPGFLLLVLYLALFPGVFGVLVTRPRSRPFDAWLLVMAPAFLTLLEIARAQGPLGTGFSSLYHGLYRVPWLIQSAAVFGPWAITAFVVLVNAALYLSLHRRRIRYAAVALGGIGLLAAFALLPVSPDAGDPLRVGIVSSTVRQEVKLDGRNLGALADRYQALGREALESRPALLVFPESILPSFILDDQDVLDRLARLASDGDARILFGTGVYEDGEIRNTVALLSKTGRLFGTYAMVRPVPFGEYIPGRKLWEAVGLKGLMDSFLPVDLTPGEAFDPVGGIGTPICFESTFPGPARAFVRSGATLLAVVTNDAWFVGSSELVAHFSAAVFRAVETRRYVLQSANRGVSGLIDPRGAILASTTGEGVLSGEIHERSGLTLYARWGDLPLVLFLVFLSGVGLAARGRLTRRPLEVEGGE